MPRSTVHLSETLSANGTTSEGAHFMGMATLSIQGGTGDARLVRRRRATRDDPAGAWHVVSKNNDGDAASWSLADTGVELDIENEDAGIEYGVEVLNYSAGNFKVEISA
jgi:hypothetical protein